MNTTTTDKSLFELAQRMRRGLPNNHPQRFREALEASLLPLIRCALRSGTGHPSVVHWVRQQVANGPPGPIDPVRAAPPLARVLCERLLERIDPLPARETVLGA
jgi:hypothetical protein